MAIFRMLLVSLIFISGESSAAEHSSIELPDIDFDVDIPMQRGTSESENSIGSGADPSVESSVSVTVNRSAYGTLPSPDTCLFVDYSFLCKFRF